MRRWTRYLAAVGGRRVVFVLGALHLAAAIAYPAFLTRIGTPPAGILIQLALVAGPAFLLLFGAIRLRESDVHPEHYATVAAWTLGTPLGMAALVALYDVQPAGGIQDPVRAIPPLLAVAAATGFGLGVHSARAHSRALELRERNQELQQTQAQLEGTVESLEASNERLEQFAYAVSHDLKEPLRTVSSHLHLAQTRTEDEDVPEDTEEYIESAADGAARMQSLIEGLLQYARVETEGDELEPVDLDALVADVLSDLERRIEQHDADVTVEELPTVRGDADQLRQVFQNLLDNAIEYSGDEPPRIEVFAEREGDQWTIAVRDYGIGIDDEYTDRVFEMFERLHAVGEHEGTGIGLALVERIVERHRGDVDVDSVPGEGSTFYVSLPAATDAELQAASA